MAHPPIYRALQRLTMPSSISHVPARSCNDREIGMQTGTARAPQTERSPAEPRVQPWRDPESNQVQNERSLPEEALGQALVAPRDIAGAGFEPATFGL